MEGDVVPKAIFVVGVAIEVIIVVTGGSDFILVVVVVVVVGVFRVVASLIHILVVGTLSHGLEGVSNVAMLE